MALESKNKIGCSGATTFVVFITSLSLGAMLALLEFGMAFNTHGADRIYHAIVSIPLWILNPMGMIGWALYAKKAISPGQALWVFVFGAFLSGVAWGYLKRLIAKRGDGL